MLVLRLVLLFVVGLTTSVARSDSNEYNIKAMFILNFMKYIEWPQDVKSDVFRIGVVGKTEIYNSLLSLISNRQESKQIIVEEADKKQNYQIIVIGESENNRIEEWIRKFKNKGVLIISDECKTKNCAAINLLNINNKIRFEINIALAHEEGIKISSKLSELAVNLKP
jgi:hypothetical protein